MQQSLCAEMAEEFCFAIRCKNSGQRPAFKRKCSQCVTHCSFPRGALDHSVSTHHVPTNGLGKPLWHPVSSNCLTNNICHSLRFPRRFRRPAEWRRVRQHGRLIPETIFSLCLRLLKYLLLLRNTFNTKLLFECLRSNNKNIYIYIYCLGGMKIDATNGCWIELNYTSYVLLIFLGNSITHGASQLIPFGY